MHIFQVAFYTTGILYSLFYQPILIIYFLFVIAIYMLISALYPGAKAISVRKKIMLATWTPPSQGVITHKITVRVQKTLQLLQTLDKENRPSLTHFVIKGCGQILKITPSINGNSQATQFVPYQQANVSCLVNIDGGKDLALVLVEDVGSKSVKDIGKFITDKAKSMRKDKGGEEHKKRTGLAGKLPAFMVSILVKISSFIYHELGLTIKPLAMKKDQFGAACVTSVGMMGFHDAVAPFSPFTGVNFLVTVNAVHDAPVIQDNKIMIGKIMHCNVVVDHRYIDGGNALESTAAFKRVFENPEQYLQRVQDKKEL